MPSNACPASVEGRVGTYRIKPISSRDLADAFVNAVEAGTTTVDIDGTEVVTNEGVAGWPPASPDSAGASPIYRRGYCAPASICFDCLHRNGSGSTGVRCHRYEHRMVAAAHRLPPALANSSPISNAHDNRPRPRSRLHSEEDRSEPLVPDGATATALAPGPGR